jgi:multimeric flavodoxin WrbA
MRVMIIDGSSSSDVFVIKMCTSLDDMLIERDVPHEIVHLEERRIVPCKRCGGCWVDTPGLCKEGDDANALNRSWMASHLIVLLTRMTFGGYSSLIKDLLDKQISTSCPYMVIGKEGVEHQMRYDDQPSILAIAACDELRQCDSETFKMLVKQNGTTLHSHNAKSFVVWSGMKDKDLRDLLNATVMGMKVRA